MIIICIILFMIGFIILSLYNDLKTVVTADKNKMILYFIISIICFAIPGILTNENLFSNGLIMNYISMEIYFLILGVFQLYFMEKIFTWNDDAKIYPQLVFTIVVTILGSIGFIVVNKYFGVFSFIYFFATSFISFFIAFFFRLLWQGTIEFPDPIFQKWFYPLNRINLLPESDELRNPKIITLAFSKKPDSERPSIFKAKAPMTMNYGKFFFHFINDYNQRNPESPISFKDNNNQANGWHFYVKPNFIGIGRNINPDLTIQANKIKDQCTIICKRVK